MPLKVNDILKLYDTPFPSSRTGALYNAFSYPTKISAESEAVFIACHTSIGDTVLDPFGGSGTTGIATKLAASPTQQMIALADKLGLKPQWGPRKAYIYELSPLGALLGDVICNTNPTEFRQYALELLSLVQNIAEKCYFVKDNSGNGSIIRHIIWSDVLQCPHCKKESLYAENCVTYNPLQISDEAVCPHCGYHYSATNETHVFTSYRDKLLDKTITTRKRLPYKIYGITGKTKWSRLCNYEDKNNIIQFMQSLNLSHFPIRELNWGHLYRNGYHYGITHLHHFYTKRNAYILSCLWNQIDNFPTSIQNALRIFVLSYNSSHSTLMTRVVAKKTSSDFILTGAQSGVLYISNLPVEKNIFLGLQRKLKIFEDALKLTYNSRSEVYFFNKSSLNISLPNESIDYVFTDPPFGDFIPYSEINQLNELWLGKTTDSKQEVVINPAQNKDIETYENLMKGVFRELSRVTKAHSWCTVVFHSAKAEIWQSLSRVFSINRFMPCKAAILDKVQSTFKQTNSYVSVKGDPLILLSKSVEQPANKFLTSDEVLESVIESIPFNDDNEKRIVTKRYSEYIRICIENGIPVTLNANSPQLHAKVI